MFVFQRAASPPSVADASGCTTFIDDEPYQSLFMKWGLLRSREWGVHTYRYAFTKELPSLPERGGEEGKTGGEGAFSSQADGSSSLRGTGKPPVAALSAVELRFHHGVARDFLRELFASSCVRSDLVGDDNDHAETSTEGGRLQFRPLTCRWTTLTPLRQALVDAKVVRQVVCDAGNTASVDNTDPLYLLPTVKRVEELLPHGEVISDELRSLFLRSHSRLISRTRGDGGDGNYAYDLDDTEVAAAADEDIDDEDEDDTWGSAWDSKLSIRQLRGVFGEASRQEFLYHIVWRLIAGSGPLNQFEDDAAVYLDAARELYRFLIRSIQVRDVGEPETDANTAGTEAAAKHIDRYQAVVETSVYEVATAPGMIFFPRSDGVHPSNLNYCYVIVNPTEQTATIWYHRC